MANIDLSQFIETVSTAFEGRQVRQAFVDALTAVQTVVNELDQTIIQHKTATQVVSSATPTVAVPLDIDGDPAQIIVTLRQDDTPTPYQNFCVHVAKFNGKYNAVVFPIPDSPVKRVLLFVPFFEMVDIILYKKRNRELGTISF